MCIGYLHFGSHFRFIIVIEKMIGSSTMNLEIVRRH